MGCERAIVVGGGLIGITTAYELMRRGIATTLVEEREGVALETSFANGATLTPSMSDPWNTPGIHRHLIQSVVDPQAAMKLRLSAVPSLLSWGTRFLRNSTTHRHWRATQASFKLAQFSTHATRSLAKRLDMTFDAASTGTMKIYRDARSFDSACSDAERLSALGLRYQALGADAAVRREPALAPIGDKLTGALFYPDDMTGDAHQFCNTLLQAFRAGGGELRLCCRVTGLRTDHGRIVGVEASAAFLPADIVVIAAATASNTLLAQVRNALPIQPVKGYTVTYNRPVQGPSIPVVDDALHAIVVPLGERIRIAGTAEFAGNDRSIRPERIANLVRLLVDIYPDVAATIDTTSGKTWAGLRPMSVDGLPFIGRTVVAGLYANSGHGHLGWTCAVGSAILLADAVQNLPSNIDPTPYSLGSGRTLG